jgi:anti-sigma-K factor RskA
MGHNERYEELLAAQALDLPLGAETSELEAHRLEGCAQCEELLSELRVAATALAVSVPPVAPPPELRARVLASLGPGRVGDVDAEARRSSGWTPARVFALAASLLLLAVVLDDAHLRREREEMRSQSAELQTRLSSAQTELAQRQLRARVLESDDVRMLLLGGHGPQPDAKGRVFWSPKARRGMLVASRLSPLPSDRQYQLWVFLEGKPVDAGVFDADPQGNALFESKDFPRPEAQNFAVTIEPRGGMPAPTGPIVLVGAPSQG